MQNNLKNRAQNTYNDVQEKVAQSLEEAKGKVVDFSQKTAKDVNVQVHRKPWHFIGVAALFSAIVGFFLGRKNQK